MTSTASPCTSLQLSSSDQPEELPSYQDSVSTTSAWKFKLGMMGRSMFVLCAGHLRLFGVTMMRLACAGRVMLRCTHPGH